MPLDHQPVLDDPRAWTLISALRARLREGAPIGRDAGLRLGDAGELLEVPPERAWVVLRPQAPRGWAWAPGAPAHAAAWARMLDLYVPLCTGPGAERLVVAHLAQSLDGRIATASGVSQFISGPEDLLHTHRLRALFDAVVVGASTVEQDDPQLTTRLCPGDDPVRVVIDPLGRIGAERRVVREGPTPTLLVQRQGRRARALAEHVTVVPVAPSEDQWLPIPAILDALQARGLRRIFIEGGGVTVSRFLEAGRLDRLQVSVSPLIIGSGRPAFTLPEVLDLEGARALQAQTFVMGRDVLFDCPLAPRR
ncbi:MAG: RibD family protein [Myxococcales bacterium]|nr:RibD family protein [Myxococcales bacterium]